ncbi:hypothetical protein Tco_0312399 [Tanacetum coccineum]
MTSTNSSTATLPFLQNILDLYFKHFKLPKDVVDVGIGGGVGVGIGGGVDVGIGGGVGVGIGGGVGVGIGGGLSSNIHVLLDLLVSTNPKPY